MLEFLDQEAIDHSLPLAMNSIAAVMFSPHDQDRRSEIEMVLWCRLQIRLAEQGLELSAPPARVIQLALDCEPTKSMQAKIERCLVEGIIAGRMLDWMLSSAIDGPAIQAKQIKWHGANIGSDYGISEKHVTDHIWSPHGYRPVAPLWAAYWRMKKKDGADIVPCMPGELPAFFALAEALKSAAIDASLKQSPNTILSADEPLYKLRDEIRLPQKAVMARS